MSSRITHTKIKNVIDVKKIMTVRIKDGKKRKYKTEYWDEKIVMWNTWMMAENKKKENKAKEGIEKRKKVNKNQENK